MNEIEAALIFLRKEKLIYDQVIETLERLEKLAELALPKKRGRRRMSVEERRKVSQCMRNYWSKRKGEHEQSSERSRQSRTVGGDDGRSVS
jgi:hypothetical protein